MDYLWTPWRYAYVSSTEKTGGCVFCDAPKEKDDAKTLIVHRGEYCFVILNAYPYTPGHVMIVPYAHLDELQKLPREAANEMMALSQRMETVLRELYRPDGINLGMNIGKAAGAGIAGTHSHARFAALGGGCEFCVSRRRDARVAGDAGCDVEEDAGRDEIGSVKPTVILSGAKDDSAYLARKFVHFFLVDHSDSEFFCLI